MADVTSLLDSIHELTQKDSYDSSMVTPIEFYTPIKEVVDNLTIAQLQDIVLSFGFNFPAEFIDYVHLSGDDK